VNDVDLVLDEQLLDAAPRPRPREDNPALKRGEALNGE
jgi:hypothetical protein